MATKKKVTTATEIENDEVQLDSENDEVRFDKDSENRIDKIVKEATSVHGKWTYELSTPIKYEENEYKSLTFNFENLTGKEALEIEDELAMSGKPVFMNETANARYLMHVALRACEERIDFETLKELNIYDFNRIKNQARLFLLRFPA